MVLQSSNHNEILEGIFVGRLCMERLMLVWEAFQLHMQGRMSSNQRRTQGGGATVPPPRALREGPGGPLFEIQGVSKKTRLREPQP